MSSCARSSVTASRLLWDEAGRPDPRKPVRDLVPRGECYWCGTGCLDRACRVQDVLGSSFTDHDHAVIPLSPWICEPCTWSLTGRPPDTLRLWSVLYREDRPAAPSHEKAPRLGARTHLQNKADPSAFSAALRDPPAGRWICSIADSGQIHVVPFALVNESRTAWRVRFERVDVASTPDAYARVSDAMASLYEAGFSKEEIASGSPAIHRLRGGAREIWRMNDSILATLRGSPLFELSLFLLRRTNARRNETGG